MSILHICIIHIKEGAHVLVLRIAVVLLCGMIQSRHGIGVVFGQTVFPQYPGRKAQRIIRFFALFGQFAGHEKETPDKSLFKRRFFACFKGAEQIERLLTVRSYVLHPARV